jgi:hypothetical protein
MKTIHRFQPCIIAWRRPSRCFRSGEVLLPTPWLDCLSGLDPGSYKETPKPFGFNAGFARPLFLWVAAEAFVPGR